MWRLWAQDYFTSALPFAQRGSAPTLPIVVDNFTGTAVASLLGTSDGSGFNYHYSNPDPTKSLFTTQYLGTDSAKAVHHTESYSDSVNAINDSISASGSSAKVTLSGFSMDGVFKSDVVLDDIRRLAISQLELERMARTDGTYEEFGLSFYGTSSRNAIDFKPLYVGFMLSGCFIL